MVKKVKVLMGGGGGDGLEKLFVLLKLATNCVAMLEVVAEEILVLGTYCRFFNS